MKTVLVVDDDPEARETLADILRVAGYAVRTAENGRDALELALSMAPVPWAVVLDFDMPEMNGHDLVTALRRHRRLATIPMILLTGHSAVADELRVACTAYLRKPLSPNVLLAVLTDLAHEPARSSG